MSTLSELLARARVELRDGDGTVWSEAELEGHLRAALQQYSLVRPRRATVLLRPTAGSRALPLDALAGRLEVLEVCYPYAPAAPAYPLSRPAWGVQGDDTLYLEVEQTPDGDVTRQALVTYSSLHTVAGLDGAAVTTLDALGEGTVILGATAGAAMQLALDAIGRVTVSGWTPRQWREWAGDRRAAFADALEAARRRSVAAQEARVAPRT